MVTTRMATGTRDGEAPGAVLLKAAEVSEVLGVSRCTIWSWHSSGRIPLPIRIGGVTRWRRSEIEAWVAAGAPARETWEHRRAIEVASDKQGRIK